MNHQLVKKVKDKTQKSARHTKFLRPHYGTEAHFDCPSLKFGP